MEKLWDAHFYSSDAPGKKKQREHKKEYDLILKYTPPPPRQVN